MASSKHQIEYIKLDTHKCIACWKCVEACPEDVIGKVQFLWHKHAIIDLPKECLGCMKCVTICPKMAFISIPVK